MRASSSTEHAREKPLPCAHCNSDLKFSTLVERAAGFDAAVVATGHYARLARDGGSGRYLLLRARDAHKDQSYVLYGLRQEQLARAEGWKVAKRSDLAVDAEPRVDIVVLDSIGELATVYQLGTVVFVGGSLVDHGGHNILEPAIFGKPIVVGPHMHNFREIAETAECYLEPLLS